MWPLLKNGGGSGTERDVAIVANLSARVGSIGDNHLGGWHSYRSSKSALNQCMLFFFKGFFSSYFLDQELNKNSLCMKFHNVDLCYSAVTKTISVEFARKKDPIICILLHPGTVDTDLSRPFQRNVPEGKLFTKEYSVQKLLSIINGAKRQDNGKFFAWDGQEIPW